MNILFIVLSGISLLGFIVSFYLRLDVSGYFLLLSAVMVLVGIYALLRERLPEK